MRYVERPAAAGPPHAGARATARRCGCAPPATLPDDPVLHVCLVAYASDISLLETSVRVHGLSWGTGDIVGASLDHAMWFHAPFRADEWWLYDQQSPWTGAGRGLARGGDLDGGRRAGRVRRAGGPGPARPRLSPRPTVGA